MNHDECKAKIAEMLPDVLTYLQTETDRLLRCGAINLEDEEPETYGMAKNILSVALENAVHQYSPMPWMKKELKDCKNLRHF
jgi:hypothetical protein